MADKESITGQIKSHITNVSNHSAMGTILDSEGVLHKYYIPSDPHGVLVAAMEVGNEWSTTMYGFLRSDGILEVDGLIVSRIS